MPTRRKIFLCRIIWNKIYSLTVSKIKSSSDSESLFFSFHRSVTSKMRVRQPIYAFGVSFASEEVPQNPHEKVHQIVELVKDNQVEVIQKLFNNRPIWSRNALEVHMSQVSHGRLKQLLSLVAYYFLNGPWRTLWVKFGYDPRKNPGAKM